MKKQLLLYIRQDCNIIFVYIFIEVGELLVDIYLILIFISKINLMSNNEV